jgi:RecA-family ATPase
MPTVSDQPEMDAPPDDGAPQFDYSDEPRANGHAPVKMPPPAENPPAPPIDWASLAGDPPPRIWWLPEWLGPDPTLTAGAGGTGKTRLWQAIGTSLATGRPYLGPVASALRVLIWSCEEDRDEIWRMQVAINHHFGLTLTDLVDRLHIVPRRGLENTLLELVLGKPMMTPLYAKELHQQVNDLKADVLILDNIAQVFGGNESDRHQATMFVNAVAGLVRDRPFCPVLLGHVARSAGSEFSGSAAWENAVRMRWYLGPTLPDQKPEEDEPVEPDVVYLAKRKTNYTAKDWRRLRFRNGLLVPDEPEGRRFDQAYRDDDAERVVLEAMPKLLAAGLLPTDAKNGADYLPTQIVAKKYAQGFSKKDLVSAMNRLMGAGRLRREKVGLYSNRSARYGLVMP